MSEILAGTRCDYCNQPLNTAVHDCAFAGCAPIYRVPPLNLETAGSHVTPSPTVKESLTVQPAALAQEPEDFERALMRVAERSHPATCAGCGGEHIEVVEQRSTGTDRDGEAFDYTSPMTRCNDCGEEYYTSAQARIADARHRDSIIAWYKGRCEALQQQVENITRERDTYRNCGHLKMDARLIEAVREVLNSAPSMRLDVPANAMGRKDRAEWAVFVGELVKAISDVAATTPSAEPL